MSKATEKELLRAFVDPVMYPILLEEYTKNPMGEDRLKKDIELARAKYKEIVAAEKKPVEKPAPKKIVKRKYPFKRKK